MTLSIRVIRKGSNLKYRNFRIQNEIDRIVIVWIVYITLGKLYQVFLIIITLSITKFSNLIGYQPS